MPEPLVAFRGAVSCQRAPGALRLTLSGEAAPGPGARVTLTFSAAAAADLPAVLHDPLVEELAANEYRVSSAKGAWVITAPAVHLHREIAAEFYRAIPPRPMPPLRRLLWRIVLALAGSRAGLAVLRALRR
jgi:hypothetical protein